MRNKLETLDSVLVDVIRGVFPNIRDDVAVFLSNPKYMGKKEKSRLRHYQVVSGRQVVEFDASLIVCLDDSQLLTIAKYKVDGRDVIFGVWNVNGV